MRNIVVSVLVLIVAALSAHIAPVSAQAYPSQPVRLVVPVAPGGPTDILTRAAAPRFGEALGQQIIVDNRAGAGGNIAMGSVAKAAPDGYTVLVADMALATNPSLYKTVPYAIKDSFAPVGLIATASLVLVVHPSVPAKNVKELITMARSQPGKLSYGGAPGTPMQFGPEALKESYSLNILSVPYKGSALAVTDLVGGRLTFAMVGVSVAKGFIESGKLRALAITGHKRAIALPEVLTFEEGGVPLPDLDRGSWWGLAVPAGAPKDVVHKLNEALHKTLGSQELRERLAAMNFEARTGSPEEFGALIDSEVTKWARVIQRAGIKVE